MAADAARGPVADLPELRSTVLDGRALAWREAGRGRVVVLLHGIGSGSASWRGQLAALSARYRVIAWDAPGYGGSDPLPGEAPDALDYAAALAGLLDVLGVLRAHVVGHSLGAMIAAAFCRHFADRVETMTLADPAAGYGSADAAVRAERLAGRLHLIDGLGPEGMARERAHVLLSPDASAEALEAVRAVMRGLRPHGYRQAARLLCNGDTAADAARVSVPVLVMCGSADTVTPEAGCRDLAAAIPGAIYRSLPGLGHASYVEDPALFNDALFGFVEAPR